MIRERRPNTELDNILGYMSGQSKEISSDSERRIERFSFIYSLLMEYKPDKFIVEEVMKRFAIKKSQAYKDISDTRYVYGSYMTIDKGFEIYQQLQECARAMRWAIEDKDTKSLVKAIEAKTKILALIPDDKEIPWDKIAPSNYFMILKMADGSAKQLDFRSLLSLEPEKTIQLMEELESQSVDTTFEILESNVSQPGQ